VRRGPVTEQVAPAAVAHDDAPSQALHSRPSELVGPEQQPARHPDRHRVAFDHGRIEQGVPALGDE